MKTAPMTREKLVAGYRREFPAPHALCLQFGPTVIMVQANRPDLIKALSDYYRPFTAAAKPAHITVSLYQAPAVQLPVTFTVKQPAPGKTRIKEEYIDLPDGRIVRKRATGMLFIFGQGEHLAVGPCLENLNQVVNFINNRHIERLLCDGWLLGHAAGVVVNGSGLALAGFSGAGKSTLALHLMSRGASFVSNDRLMIKVAKKRLSMRGVAKWPRINPGTALNNTDLSAVIPPAKRRWYEKLPADELWELAHKYDVSIEKCFGKDRYRLQSPMHALVILNWQRHGRPLTAIRVNPMERQDLLAAFMKSSGLFFRPFGNCGAPRPALEAYTDLVVQCRMYEISGGTDFKAATRVCLSLSDRMAG